MTIILKFFSPIIYMLSLVVPKRKDLWLFGAWFGHRYTDNSRAVFEEVIGHDKDICAYWVTKDKELLAQILRKDLPAVHAYSLKGVALQMRAGVFFMTTNSNDFFFPCLSFRVIQIQLWHGTPIKKIGLDALGALQKLKFKVRSLLLDKYTFVLSQNALFDQFLASAFGIGIEKIVRFNNPRTDIFKLQDEKIQSIKMRVFGTDSKPALNLVYLPTHRMEGRSPGRISELIQTLGGMDTFLEENGIRIFFKPHFYERSLPLDYIESLSCIKMLKTEDDDLYEILAASDGLITDISSVVFDYALLAKPIIFFMPDMDDYIADDRSFYVSPVNFMGQVIRTQSEMKHALRTLKASGKLGGTDSLVFNLARQSVGSASREVIEYVRNITNLSPSLGREVE